MKITSDSRFRLLFPSRDRGALCKDPAGGDEERTEEQLKQSTKLFADETTAPVLDPGRGQVKKGQLWAYARDERPWQGVAPPGVAYVYAPDRKHRNLRFISLVFAGFCKSMATEPMPSSPRLAMWSSHIVGRM